MEERRKQRKPGNQTFLCCLCSSNGVPGKPGFGMLGDRLRFKVLVARMLARLRLNADG